jgi:hypothetical protein
MNRKLKLVAVVVALAGLAFTFDGVSRLCAGQEARMVYFSSGAYNETEDPLFHAAHREGRRE